MGRIYKRGKGWYLDYRNATGKRIQRRAGRDKTKAQQLLATAEAKAAAVKLGVASPDAEIADAEIDTLRSAYLDHLRLHRRPRTVESAESSLATILGHLGAVRASHLNVQEVERYQKHRRESVRARTVNIETGALKAMLNWAVEARLLRESPLARLKPLRQDREEKKHRRALKPEEARALIETARAHYPRHADFFLCALHTGMRRGELAALRRSDVDFENREIVVRAEVAKNHRKRRIPLTREIEARLRVLLAEERSLRPLSELVDRLADRERKQGRKPDRAALEAEARGLQKVGAERVFTTEYGTPVGNNLNRILAKLLKRAGVNPHGVDIHALRYTYGSWLVREGVNIKLVSCLLGHATVQLTLDIYTDAGIMDWHGAAAKLPALEAESGSKRDAGVTGESRRAQLKVG